MRHMVFFEGLDKTGKTTLCRALSSWRRDVFTYFDRGPWSRYALGRFYGYQGIEPALAIMRQAAPVSVVVCVHRDLDEVMALQTGAEGLDRDALEAQERLFEDAFAAVPPATLLHVHHVKGAPPGVLLEEVQRRLSVIADGAPAAAQV